MDWLGGVASSVRLKTLGHNLFMNMNFHGIEYVEMVSSLVVAQRSNIPQPKVICKKKKLNLWLSRIKVFLFCWEKLLELATMDLSGYYAAM